MKIRNLIIDLIIIGIAIYMISIIYPKYNFNEFEKSVSEQGKTNFTRDNTVRYTKEDSYKIENMDYTDALFFKTIEVTPNTPYRVTCKVKTNQVESINGKISGGAHIAISGTLERSQSITGTQDWTELTFLFNSKNRNSVNIAFRLGGYDDKTKGEAWFTDFKIEQGMLDTDKNWHFACFIFQNVDATAKGEGLEKKVNLTMREEDKQDIYDDMERLKNTCEEFSNGLMRVTYEIIEIQEPITTISYSEADAGFYIDPIDVQKQIDHYVKEKEYDHIYIATVLGDLNSNHYRTQTADWVGLGGMDYYGIGFSNLRLPNSENNYTYKFDYRINTFPEEVMLHEFLHTLERNSKEYGYDIIELHASEEYGYRTEKKVGLKAWYEDYMQGNIQNRQGEKVGLKSHIYTSKPIHNSNFQISMVLDSLKEPENIFQEIQILFKRTKNMLEEAWNKRDTSHNQEINAVI